MPARLHANSRRLFRSFATLYSKSAPRAIAPARVADGRTDPQEVLVGEAAAVEEQRVPRADVPQHVQEAHLRSQYRPVFTGTHGVLTGYSRSTHRYSWVLMGTDRYPGTHARTSRSITLRYCTCPATSSATPARVKSPCSFNTYTEGDSPCAHSVSTLGVSCATREYAVSTP